MKKWVFVLLLIFFINFGSAALGISPPKKDIQFVSGEEHILTFTVISDNPYQELILYTEGDLSQYVRLDKEEMTGPGTFNAIIKLPSSIDEPGKHRILIGAREKPREDQFLGTAVNIRAAVDVFVPYPGKYIEATINVPDVNAGDDIPLEVYAINRGKESVELIVDVDFLIDEEMAYTTDFSPVFLESGQDRYFRKIVNSDDLRPGNYFATANLNYGELRTINSSFKVGSLLVNIINFTDQLPPGSINKFFVGIESRWNNNLPEVYADVNISNSSYSLSFRTPSIDLLAWQHGLLEGYLDTSSLSGEYDSNITLRYAGQENSKQGQLRISEGLNMTYVYIAIGLVLVIVILTVVFFLFVRKKKKRR